MNLTLGKSISYLRQSAFYVQHAACLSGAGYPSRWDCLLSSSLFIPMKRSPLQRNFPGLTCQRKPPPPNIWWFQGGARSRGWYLAPAAISPHPSPGFGGRFGMDGCAQIATSLLLGLGCGLGGELFSLTVPGLRFNFCHCSFSFHCRGRTFFHCSVWSHQKQKTPWEAAGGTTPPRRSPRFAERGHSCLTFLLEFSIPTAPSRAACQSRPPSLPPLCHRCFCSLLSSSRGGHQRSKGASRPNSKQGSLWCTAGGLASYPEVATGMKPDGPLHSHVEYLELPHHLSTCGFSITTLHNIKERLFPFFHR